MRAGMTPETIPSDEALELSERFQSILTGSWKTQALYVAAELRLADLLAAGPQTSTALASAAGTHQPSLHRLLRALSTLGLCLEQDDGRFALTPLGQLLQEDSPHSLRACTLWWGKHLWPVWGNLLYSVMTGKSARTLLLGTVGFEHLEKDPEAAATFYRVTIELTRQTAELLLQAYDFSGFGRIVDVGGGHGELLARILRANPKAAGVLFDLPVAVEGATKAFQQNHPGLLERCAFVAGDFFEGLPAGADAYLLKSVLHDWDDEQCARILANCRRAMAEQARLLIIEPILPSRSEATALQATLSQHDLTMLAALGAQERRESAFSALLQAADLRISRILAVGPVYSLIECQPA
jgi:hypothetical protein